ncbi:MAG TPA: hypothetical protein VHL54_00395 [Actinomycetota bacterium]|nr:hypothetical protein [Actinomycetota bacterium]
MSEEQEVLAEAERTRATQVDVVGYEIDPAIQAGIDAAKERDATGPEPGSDEPGFMGLGGLSKGEVEAQKQDIAQRASKV